MKVLNWIKRFLTSRFFFVGTIIMFQLFLLIYAFNYLYEHRIISIIISILNIILAIYIVNRNVNDSFKLVWIFIIIIMPFVGSILYILFAERRVPRNLRSEMIKEIQESEYNFKQKKTIVDKFDDDDIKQQFNYIANNAYYPYYNNTDIKYFNEGELFFDDLIEHIKEAKKFIFLEFFIIKEGMMLETLIYILRQKVIQGVEVIVMYDDFGCLDNLPKKFKENMKNYGIKCVAFNPITIHLALLSKANNRNHRKICVIDNNIGYMGGLNIGDEYINKQLRFGHWKDSAIRLSGEAVSSLTIMFIQFYNALGHENLIYDDYISHKAKMIKRNNYILPFSCSPTDDENVARSVHYNLINKAKKYIYINTPYLILDRDLLKALENAAKCGVEVIITVPHIPDKKTIFMVTRSNYIPLLKTGVKIYEYTPGFMHSKLIICDDKIALVGTINMDFRSYYLHYECGTLIANDKSIEDMKKDYLNTLKKSELISLENVKKDNIIISLLRSIMNIIAPLL